MTPIETGWKLYAGLTAALVVLVGAIWYFTQTPATEPEATPAPTPAAVEEVPPFTESVIGSSVEGRVITATTFGTGATHLLFVGGIHGGYEWNSSLLAYEMIDYLAADASRVPSDLSITIIPVLNPDGLALVVPTPGPFTLADVQNPGTRLAAGRFNANEVDLNRNFDCKWQPASTWRGNTVSAGTAAFSEPEAAALRDWVTINQPAAAVFWHSQANNVYASECEAGVLPGTLALMNTYADATTYGAVPVFDAYPVTGDAEGWLASIGIPAVTVELKGYQTTEWVQNLAGTMAVLQQFSTLE